VDFPETLFRDLKTLAAHRGVPMRELILTAVEKELSGKTAPGYRVKSPLVHTKGRRIHLTNAEIEDLLA
jgi:hypothetical protein